MPSSGSDVPEHIASTPVNFVIGGLKHAPSNAAAAKAGGSVITPDLRLESESKVSLTHLA